MVEYEIIDTIDDFLIFWESYKDSKTSIKIDKWLSEYMSKWSELRNKQLDDYEKTGEDWRRIAHEHVFNNLHERIPIIKKAYSSLKEILPFIVKKFEEKLPITFNLFFIIYVGIGLGAGWATEYMDQPAVLFGLENIAEEKWEDKETLKGLSAHEIGHLYHFNLRRKKNLEIEYQSSFWQLYEEGFAMRCEHIVMEKESWHQRRESINWLKWCKKNKSSLSSKFLNYVNKNMDLKNFFGSWFDVDGYKQTGYFLGHEIIKEWEKAEKLEKIAIKKIEDIDEYVKNILEFWSIQSE